MAPHTSSPHPHSLTPRRHLRPWVVGLLAAGLGGCTPSGRNATHGKAQRGVVVLVAGDTAGWINPCGCAANQSGGLLRRGTYARAAGSDQDLVLADAGGAPGGTALYDQLKFEAILAGERVMGLSAHNLGGPEAALGAEYLRDLERRTGTPFVSANLRDSRGILIASPVRLVAVGGMRIALVGVVAPQMIPRGLNADEPRDAVLNAARDVRAGYDALVVLAYLPESELRRFAADLPEADLVIGGPTGQSIAPVRVGPTWLAAATNKGKFLVRMETAGRASPWTGRVVEMNPGIADDPLQRKNLDAFHAALAKRDLAAEETGLVPPLIPGLPETFRVAGSASCISCHEAEGSSWKPSKHANAWRSLRASGSQADPQCQKCHTTGYGLPGGFRSLARSPERTSVGCESCHGPAQEHALGPAARTSFAARDQCLSCHDEENSPRFEYDRYWEQIRHGALRKPTAGSPAESRP